MSSEFVKKITKIFALILSCSFYKIGGGYLLYDIWLSSMSFWHNFDTFSVF